MTSKYHNIRTEYKGRFYASKKEVRYAAMLDQLKRAEQKMDRVVFWLPQVPFLFASGIRMIVDFVVFYADQHYEIHEVKGGNATKTQAYKLKKKLLFNEYNLDIKEV
jgi:hypothetical protein